VFYLMGCLADDWLGAVGVFLLVFFSTFPVVEAWKKGWCPNLD
jgi:hypothetical protein